MSSATRRQLPSNVMAVASARASHCSYLVSRFRPPSDNDVWKGKRHSSLWRVAPTKIHPSSFSQREDDETAQQGGLARLGISVNSEQDLFAASRGDI